MPTYAWIPGHAGVHGNEVADYVAKSGSKSIIHGPESFITVPYASCVSAVKDWSIYRWKFMWNERKDCLRMNESAGFVTVPILFAPPNFRTRLFYLALICVGLRVIVFFNFRTF